MKYKGVIFDLDGTLVDSLKDLSDAMNTVLSSLNHPTHSYETYKSFIGGGIRSLVSKALPSNQNNDEQITICFNAMIAFYRDRCTQKTKPYDGIIELLDSLVSRQVKLSVLSNKSDEFTKKITHALFPNYFDPVIGLTIETLRKPNPQTVLEIANTLDLKPKELMDIGDTGIDMQTAINANMFGVGVLWGFREREELLAKGASAIIKHPLDLLALL